MSGRAKPAKARRRYVSDPAKALSLLVRQPRDQIRDECLRMNTALTMLAVHQMPGQSEWLALADAVNFVETLIADMHRVSPEVFPLVEAATLAMTAAARRLREGKSQGVRLDGPGLQAVRAVAAIYEQCLTELTAAEVERMRQITSTRVQAHLAGKKAGREVVTV